MTMTTTRKTTTMTKDQERLGTTKRDVGGPPGSDRSHQERPGAAIEQQCDNENEEAAILTMAAHNFVSGVTLATPIGGCASI